MGRKKIYYRYDHPDTLVHIVEAIIADHPRRERMLAYTVEGESILAEYRRLNAAIDGAVNSFEPELARIICADIINHNGYFRSKAATMTAKRTYYRRKTMLIHDVACALNLIT